MYKVDGKTAMRIDPFETLRYTVVVRDNRGLIDVDIPKMDNLNEHQLDLLFSSVSQAVEVLKSRITERKTAG